MAFNIPLIALILINNHILFVFFEYFKDHVTIYFKKGIGVFEYKSNKVWVLR